MIERADVMRTQIEREPVRRKAEVIPLDAAQAAHRGVGAVRADHVTGAHGARLARGNEAPRLLLADPAERQLHVVGVLDELLGAPPALDRRRAARSAVERGFQVWLEEQVVGFPARRRGGLRAHRHDRLAVGAEPAVLVDRQQVVLQLVDDPELLPDPHDLVVEVDRARQVVQAAEPLEDAHAVARA